VYSADTSDFSQSPNSVHLSLSFFWVIAFWAHFLAESVMMATLFLSVIGLGMGLCVFIGDLINEV
jgi:hypothetical protein